MAQKNAIILGIHSFVDSGVKVGIQYIAEGLAKLDWRVDYISFPSSILDSYGLNRQKRLKRVWLRRQDRKGIKIRAGLTEYAFRTLHPAHKLFLSSKYLMDNYSCLAPAWLKKRQYDLCIHDITTNVLFIPMINSNLWVLRLNDSPDGFSSDLHPNLVNHFKKSIASLVYDEIWAVSAPLARYALNLNSKNCAVVIPNGVENSFYPNANSNRARNPKTAVFLGSISNWVDMELLEKTATLMPDWKFYIYGPCDSSWEKRAPNIKLFPSVKHSITPKLLSNFQVGLIPFRETANLTEHIERPLKFYEYIASGLGIASTDVGNLKAGMGDMAFYGNTPSDFSKAIERAAQDCLKRTIAFNREFLKKHSWENVLKTVCARISGLQSR